MKSNDCETLECKLLYVILVAGKSARATDALMPRLADALRSVAPMSRLWFPAVRRAIELGKLSQCLRKAGTGRYESTERAFADAVSCGINLHECSLSELEAIHGVGRKTARVFLNWCGRHGRFAVLDVHILSWLGEQGHDVPESTPQSAREYRRCEELFLAEADTRELRPYDLDQEIWLAKNKSGRRDLNPDCY